MFISERSRRKPPDDSLKISGPPLLKMPLAARANSPISSLTVRPFSPRLFRQEPSSNLQLPSAGCPGLPGGSISIRPGCTVCPEWNWIIKGEGLKHPKTLVFPVEKHQIPKSLNMLQRGIEEGFAIWRCCKGLRKRVDSKIVGDLIPYWRSSTFYMLVKLVCLRKRRRLVL